VATLRRRDVDVKTCSLAVCEKPEFRFTPKDYECRKVRVPAALANRLKTHMKTLTGALLFPTKPHPTRPKYGGEGVDAHHLELCKTIAFRAKLNWQAMAWMLRKGSPRHLALFATCFSWSLNRSFGAANCHRWPSMLCSAPSRKQTTQSDRVMLIPSHG
jgi:hypothetical protein